MPSGSKLCATCNYWVGPREPDYFASGVELPDQCTKGKCWCLNGPFPRSERFSNNGCCSRYEKWAILR